MSRRIKLKDDNAEVHETESFDFYCNGHRFETLKEARAYKKKKNAEYGYVKHEIHKNTYRTVSWSFSERVR